MQKAQRQLIKTLGVSDAPTLGNTAVLARINLGPAGQGTGMPAWSPFDWLILAITCNQNSAASGVAVYVSYDNGANFDLVGASTYSSANGWWKFKKHLPEGGIVELRWTGNGTTPATFRGAVYLSNESVED
jgi:hypothetical protein